MNSMSSEKIYLLIGLTTASLCLAGGAAQAQTYKSPTPNTLTIAKNVESIAPNFDRTDAKTNYDFMAQLSAPQPNGTSQSAPLDNSVPSNGTPTNQSTPLDNTVPRDTNPTTTPNTLDNTVPNDGTPTNQSAPLDNTVPSDGTPTTPSNTPYNTAPSDGSPTTPSTTPTPPPSDGTPTTPTTPTPPPSDGSNPPLNNVNPGRATRSGSSYIGVGGNIGIGGNTGIGEGSFSVISKIGLTRNLSARPAVLFGNDATVLLPVTLDFPIESLQSTKYRIAPYVGAGAVISTGNDSNVGLLLTGGVDVPVSTRFTATAGVNVGFTGDTDVGVLLGIGYNFSGL